MDLRDAERMAREALDAHGFAGTPIVWSNARRTFGMWSERWGAREWPGSPVLLSTRLTLSRPLVRVNDERRVRETVLHEVAHALAGARAQHGPAWRAACARLGIPSEQRCFSSDDATLPPGAFEGRCPTCARKYVRYRRPLASRRYHCAKCGYGSLIVFASTALDTPAGSAKVAS